ncbi:MAG: hypothetical protein QOC68_3734 [Solirubrobacteraceae bacterium]|jgi:hypothetical protein|nr:hypothetical protein [Solirubrobacteraceae bacterium]
MFVKRVAFLVLTLLLAAPAEARLRPVAKLTAKAGTSGVRLAWKDRARGETRYEVRRRGRRARLKANRRTWTDHRAAPATRYRYTVRACRRRHCARGRSVTITTRRRTGGSDEAGPIGGGTPGGDAFAGSPVIGACPVFPADNPWNQDVSQAPVDTAHGYAGSLAAMTLWPDFGGGGAYGIPFVSVPFTQPLVPVSFDVADESDPGPYPTPLDAPVEGGSDRHVLTLRQGDCKLFEISAAAREGSGWHAYSGAAWDLRSNALRPERWTSADAAGLPMLPGLARRDEADSGVIRHALRITVPATQRAYIHPATHWASSSTDTSLPPMGLRLRLKASYDIGGLRGQARAVAQALKTYGAIVADNGGGSPRVYVGGAVDPGWNDEDLNGIKAIPASALEAVQTGPVVTP